MTGNDIDIIAAKKKLSKLYNELIDHSVGKYMKRIGIFGSTSKGTRTLESDIDIILDIDSVKNSIFDIPIKDWKVIKRIIVNGFGINPYTNKPYVTDIVGLYEVKKFNQEELLKSVQWVD